MSLSRRTQTKHIQLGGWLSQSSPGSWICQISNKKLGAVMEVGVPCNSAQSVLMVLSQCWLPSIGIVRKDRWIDVIGMIDMDWSIYSLLGFGWEGYKQARYKAAQRTKKQVEFWLLKQNILDLRTAWTTGPLVGSYTTSYSSIASLFSTLAQLSRSSSRGLLDSAKDLLSRANPAD